MYDSPVEDIMNQLITVIADIELTDAIDSLPEALSPAIEDYVDTCPDHFDGYGTSLDELHDTLHDYAVEIAGNSILFTLLRVIVKRMEMPRDMLPPILRDLIA